MVEAWLMDSSNEDQRLPHRRSPNVSVSLEQLQELGVIYRRVNMDNWQSEIDSFLKEYNYKTYDKITCSPSSLPDYDTKIKMFYEEHIHEDEEVRFVVEGTGYFDVRDKNDDWVRIKVEPSDLLVLPAGIYHRFTLDETNHAVAMRLFKEVPKWTPINRPEADSNPYRQEYMKTVLSGQ